MRGQNLKQYTHLGVSGLIFCFVAACEEAPSANTVGAGFNWGTNESEWANDGDCDDPRFYGPWAHSLLVPEDVLKDANDCRTLFAEGKIFLRLDYQEGQTYENESYAGPN